LTTSTKHGSFEKCLAIEEKAEATFPLDLGHLHIRIAEVNRKQGEYGMAINAYRVPLSIYESALGRDYEDSITCLRGIESCLYEMNLSDSVIQEYPESIFKSFHHCQKGIAYMKSNKFREAVNEYEAARLIEENSLGKYGTI
jgi:tetratricopeptide (TPR) repeat protein